MRLSAKTRFWLAWCHAGAALCVAWAAAGGITHAVVPLPSNFAEFNTNVAGFQDFFQGDTLSSDWTVYGNRSWSLSGNGYLLAASGTTDPRQLLYSGAVYDGTVQDVLAMVRVTNFE